MLANLFLIQRYVYGNAGTFACLKVHIYERNSLAKQFVILKKICGEITAGVNLVLLFLEY